MEYDCSGIRVEQTRGGWGFNVEKFPQQVRQLAEACGLRRGERIRVFSAGWGTALTTTLLRRYGVSFPGARQFGDNIAVFSVPVGAELLSESLRQADARVRLGLARLARLCERSMPGPVRAAFWPSYYFADSALLLMRHVTSLLLPFSELPRLSGIGFEAQLPALVFYVFGTTEPVPDYISAAAGRANHVSGGCRFRLLAIDPDSVAAVIRVDPAWAAP
jgi:hypothetical protein